MESDAEIEVDELGDDSDDGDGEAASTQAVSEAKKPEEQAKPQLQVPSEDAVIPASQDKFEDAVIPASEDKFEDAVIPASEDKLEDAVIPASEDMFEDAVIPASQPYLEDDIIPASQLKLIQMKGDDARLDAHVEGSDLGPIQDSQIQESQGDDVIEITDTLSDACSADATLNTLETAKPKPSPEQMHASRAQLEERLAELNKQLRHTRYEAVAKILGINLRSISTRFGPVCLAAIGLVRELGGLKV